MTLDQFIEKHGITMTLKKVEENPYLFDSSSMTNHYRATLRFQGRKMSVPFSTGSAWKEDPTVKVVLNCLANDAVSVEVARSFGEWADDLGLSSDLAQWERVYRASCKQTERLKKFLGPHLYRVLVWQVDKD